MTMGDPIIEMAHESVSRSGHPESIQNALSSLGLDVKAEEVVDKVPAEMRKEGWHHLRDKENRKRRKSVEKKRSRRQSKKTAKVKNDGGGKKKRPSSFDDVILYDEFKRIRKIRFGFHRDRISDSHGTMLWYEQINFILLGKMTPFLKKENEEAQQQPSDRFFSIVTFAGKEYDFEVSNGEIRKELVMELLHRLGYRDLAGVASAFGILRPEHEVTLQLSKDEFVSRRQSMSSTKRKSERRQSSKRKSSSRKSSHQKSSSRKASYQKLSRRTSRSSRGLESQSRNSRTSRSEQPMRRRDSYKAKKSSLRQSSQSNGPYKRVRLSLTPPPVMEYQETGELVLVPPPPPVPALEPPAEDEPLLSQEPRT